MKYRKLQPYNRKQEIGVGQKEQNKRIIIENRKEDNKYDYNCKHNKCKLNNKLPIQRQELLELSKNKEIKFILLGRDNSKAKPCKITAFKTRTQG